MSPGITRTGHAFLHMIIIYNALLVWEGSPRHRADQFREKKKGEPRQRREAIAH